MEKNKVTKVKEDVITNNIKEKNKTKKKPPLWLIVVFIVAITALCSYSVTAIRYEKIVDIKKELIETAEKEKEICREQTSKLLELLDRQKVLTEEKLVRDKKNYEKLVEWVYKNSSKISKKTAEEIVNHTLTTNFPLMHLAIMKTESNFDPTSISSKGASGIGQQMPKDYKKPLIEAGIISEWRDIFDIPQGVKATEFAWNDKFKKAKGDIIKGLIGYYGENDRKYIDPILKDYHYLVYLLYLNETEKNNLEKTEGKKNGDKTKQ